MHCLTLCLFVVEKPLYIYEGELVLCLIFNIGHSIIVYCFEFCKERTVVFCASLDICKEKRCFILGDLYICCKCCKTVDLRKKNCLQFDVTAILGRRPVCQAIL